MFLVPRPRTPTGKRPSADKSYDSKRLKTSEESDLKDQCDLKRLVKRMKSKVVSDFLGRMRALIDQRSSPDVFWWDGDVLAPASYGNAKFMFVEDTSFPPEYTPYEQQGQLANWVKFAVQYNPFLMLNAVDEETVEVVLVRQSIHVAPYTGLSLDFMGDKFPPVIKLLGKSYKKSKHYEGMALSRSMHPFNCIDDGSSKNPYMFNKEYASAIIDFLIAKEIVMKEEEQTEKRETYYSVTRKGRALLSRNIYRAYRYDFKKIRSDYDLYISKFYTGPGWGDCCINPFCQRPLERDNEYTVMTDLGLNRQKASHKGFTICLDCGKNILLNGKLVTYDSEDEALP